MTGPQVAITMGAGGGGGSIPLHDLAAVFGFSGLLAALLLLLWTPTSTVDFDAAPEHELTRLTLGSSSEVSIEIESLSDGQIWVELIPEDSWEVGTTDGMGDDSRSPITLEAGETSEVTRTSTESGGHVVLVRGASGEVDVRVTTQRSVLAWSLPAIAAALGGWGVWRGRLEQVEPESGAVDEPVDR